MLMKVLYFSIKNKIINFIIFLNFKKFEIKHQNKYISIQINIKSVKLRINFISPKLVNLK